MKTEKEIKEQINFLIDVIADMKGSKMPDVVEDRKICLQEIRTLKWVLLPSPISIDEYMQQHKKIIEG